MICKRCGVLVTPNSSGNSLIGVEWLDERRGDRCNTGYYALHAWANQPRHDPKPPLTDPDALERWLTA